MPPDMMYIADRLHELTTKIQPSNPELCNASPFNSGVAIALRSFQYVPKHTDCVYNRKGDFWEALNSQQKGTPTVIIATGDRRVLHFALTLRAPDSTKKIRVRGPNTHFSFELKNGTALIIPPSVEKPSHRSGFGPIIEEQLTWWEHYVDGIDSEMSLGMAFRSCVHSLRVNKHTGLRIMTKEEQARMTSDAEEEHNALDEWCYGSRKQEKEADDHDIMRKYKRLVDTYPFDNTQEPKDAEEEHNALDEWWGEEEADAHDIMCMYKRLLHTPPSDNIQKSKY